MSTDLPGFADPVAGSQACFRAVLDAMARPGRVHDIGPALTPPAPLAPATAAVLLTLVDADTPLWLDGDAAAARDWLRFHCGARDAEPAQAAFAACLDLLPLERFGWGTHDGPEDSATIVLQRPRFDAGPAVRLSGPGLREPVTVRLGLPGDIVSRWAAMHGAFPRGVDLILCAGTRLAALPRSVRMEAA